VNEYDQSPTISVCFSDNFKALFYDIIKSVNNNNNNVYDIQEYITSSKRNYSSRETETEADIFILKQNSPILYNKELEIY
jgi:hypothetical protein